MSEPGYIGNWEGTCRACWRTRNLGVDYKPGREVACLQNNPDGSQCHGRLLVSLTKEADRQVRAGRRLKKHVPKGTT